ncbi:MAG: hypothetical protein RLZZ77_1299 [Bacteroidota bacterium]|jgi:hypothetical protein
MKKFFSTCGALLIIGSSHAQLDSVSFNQTPALKGYTLNERIQELVSITNWNATYTPVWTKNIQENFEEHPLIARFLLLAIEEHSSSDADKKWAAAYLAILDHLEGKNEDVEERLLAAAADIPNLANDELFASVLKRELRTSGNTSAYQEWVDRRQAAHPNALDVLDAHLTAETADTTIAQLRTPLSSTDDQLRAQRYLLLSKAHLLKGNINAMAYADSASALDSRFTDLLAWKIVTLPTGTPGADQIKLLDQLNDLPAAEHRSLLLLAAKSWPSALPAWRLDSLNTLETAELEELYESDWKKLSNAPLKLSSGESKSFLSTIPSLYIIISAGALIVLFMALWILSLVKNKQRKEILAAQIEEGDKLRKEAEGLHIKVREATQQTQVAVERLENSRNRFLHDLHQKTDIGAALHVQVAPSIQRVKNELDQLAKEAGNAMPVQTFLSVQNAVMKAQLEARKTAEYLIPEKIVHQELAEAFIALCDAYSNEKKKVNFQIQGDSYSLSIDKSTLLFESVETLIQLLSAESSNSKIVLSLAFWPEGVVAGIDYDGTPVQQLAATECSVIKTAMNYLGGKAEFKAGERILLQLAK